MTINEHIHDVACIYHSQSYTWCAAAAAMDSMLKNLEEGEQDLFFISWDVLAFFAKAHASFRTHLGPCFGILESRFRVARQDFVSQVGRFEEGDFVSGKKIG